MRRDPALSRHHGKLILIVRDPKWQKEPAASKFARIRDLFNQDRRRYRRYEEVVEACGDSRYVRRLISQGVLGIFRDATY